jgi:hypothetical protein
LVPDGGRWFRSQRRRWNGSTWSPLASGPGFSVTALAALPNGDVAAAGTFTTFVGGRVARWNGASWSPMAPDPDGAVQALAMLVGGTLAAGGEFRFVGGTPSATFARLIPSCSSAASSFAAGCAGSGGANVLGATSLAWIGAPYAWTATGLPAHGLALDVRGVATVATPLAAILPQGVPGCNLHVRPDVVDVLVPIAGVASASFAIPVAAALIGQVLYHQVVALELDVADDIVALTSTNALALTIGSF